MNNHFGSSAKTQPEQTLMKFYTTLVALLLFCGLANAQHEKNIHKTFQIDSVDILSINLSGDNISIEPWAGNMILAQTNIKLFDAGSRGILKYFVDQGRYDLVLSEIENGEADLSSTKQKRAPIITKNGECREEVTVKLLVPEDFIINENQSQMIREKKEEEIPEEEEGIKPAAVVEKVDNN